MPSERVLRLMYLSRVWQSMTNSQLEEILLKSRSNNPKHKITGLLCYGGTSFIQILEGPEDDVIRLYANIIDDDRHHNCKLLDVHLDSKRMFDKWAMAYVHSSQDDFEQLSEIMHNTSKKHEQTVKEVVLLLRSYLGKHLDLASKHT